MEKKINKSRNNQNNKKTFNNQENPIQSKDIEKYTPEILKAIQSSDGIPDNIKQQITKRIDIFQYEFHMSGPLPSPKLLQGYKECGKKVLDHILDSAKNEQKHRHDIEKKQADAFIESIKYSDKTQRIIPISAQICATAIIGLLLIASVILALNGNSGTAIATLLPAVIGVVSLIITGKRRNIRKKSKKR